MKKKNFKFRVIRLIDVVSQPKKKRLIDVHRDLY